MPHYADGRHRLGRRHTCQPDADRGLLSTALTRRRISRGDILAERYLVDATVITSRYESALRGAAFSRSSRSIERLHDMSGISSAIRGAKHEADQSPAGLSSCRCRQMMMLRPQSHEMYTFGLTPSRGAHSFISSRQMSRRIVDFDIMGWLVNISLAAL